MKACAQDIREVAFVARCHYHGQPNNDSTNNRSAHRIDPAQDNGRESEERYIPKSRINSNDIDS